MSTTSNAMVTSGPLPEPAKHSTETFFKAAKEGNLALLQECINQGANLEKINKAGESILMIAAKNGHLPIVNEIREPLKRRFLRGLLRLINDLPRLR